MNDDEIDDLKYRLRIFAEDRDWDLLMHKDVRMSREARTPGATHSKQKVTGTSNLWTMKTLMT